jgi:hypothetical protein
MIPWQLFVAACALCFCIGYLVADWLSWRAGVAAGYAALRWPDSPYFREAREFLNWIRARDGLPTIEEESVLDAEPTLQFPDRFAKAVAEIYARKEADEC